MDDTALWNAFSTETPTSSRDYARAFTAASDTAAMRSNAAEPQVRVTPLSAFQSSLVAKALAAGIPVVEVVRGLGKAEGNPRGIACAVDAATDLHGCLSMLKDALVRQLEAESSVQGAAGAEDEDDDMEDESEGGVYMF